MTDDENDALNAFAERGPDAVRKVDGISPPPPANPPGDDWFWDDFRGAWLETDASLRRRVLERLNS